MGTTGHSQPCERGTWLFLPLLQKLPWLYFGNRLPRRLGFATQESATVCKVDVHYRFWRAWLRVIMREVGHEPASLVGNPVWAQ
jgi:hypothetical protein